MSSADSFSHKYNPVLFMSKVIQSISDRDRVFILTSFIDAHQHTHEAVLFYLGEQEGRRIHKIISIFHFFIYSFFFIFFSSLISTF